MVERRGNKNAELFHPQKPPTRRMPPSLPSQNHIRDNYGYKFKIESWIRSHTSCGCRNRNPLSVKELVLARVAQYSAFQPPPRPAPALLNLCLTPITLPNHATQNVWRGLNDSRARGLTEIAEKITSLICAFRWFGLICCAIKC